MSEDNTTENNPSLSDILDKENIKEFRETEFGSPGYGRNAENEEDTRKDATNDEDTSSEEDTARLHVALKDPPHTEGLDNEGEVGGDCEEGVGPIDTEAETDTQWPSKEELADRDAGAADPDRERLTGVDHILDKESREDLVKESPDEDYATYLVGDVLPSGLTDSERRGVENLIINRDHWSASYHDLTADYNCLVKELDELKFSYRCRRPILREDVYKLIDSERDYQNQKFNAYGKAVWTPNDWLTLIDRYMMDALDIIADPDAQMVEIRKIAALAVAAMEHILTPARV